MQKSILYLVLLVSLALSLASCNDALRQRAEVIRRNYQSTVAERYIAEGDRLLEEGQVESAVLAYRKAVDVSPAAAIMGRAERLAREGKAQEAEGEYNKVLQADRAYALALHKLADAYAGQGRRRMAVVYYRQAARLGDADAAQAGVRLADQLKAPSPLPLRWQRTLGGDNVPAGLAASRSTLLVTTHRGQVFALDLQTGLALWQGQIAKSITGAPAVAGGLILFGGDDNALHALQASDGKPAWKFEDAKGQIFAGPAVGGDTAYFGSADGNLYAVSLQDGNLRWKYTTGGPIHASPVVREGMVYFGSVDKHLYAVDARKGTLRWQFPPEGAEEMLDAVEYTPAVAGERIYFGANNGRIYALNRANGRLVWVASAGEAEYGRLAVFKETVLSSSGSTKLVAVNAFNGQERWSWKHEAESFLKEPVLFESTLLLTADRDSRVFAFDLSKSPVRSETGQLSAVPIWKLDTGEWVAVAPLVVESTAYVATRDGTILAYSLLVKEPPGPGVAF